MYTVTGVHASVASAAFTYSIIQKAEILKQKQKQLGQATSPNAETCDLFIDRRQS